MTERRMTATTRRLVGLAMALGIVAAACGGGATSAPTAAPPTAAPPTEAPPTEAATPDPAAILADLKMKLQGTKLSVGSSAFPNASVTGAYKTLDLLKEDFGVDVSFQLMDSDPLIAAIVSGQVQVGQLSLAGVASANASGAGFVGFGVNDQKNLFLVAAKKPLSTIEEVRGKPFGVTQNLNQITGQTAKKCLATAGLDLEKDVQLIRFNNTGEATAAIRSGQVVAGISALFRLTKWRIEEGDVVNILCNGQDVNPSISSMWMADRAWVAANHDMALALIISELRAARWSKVSKDEWIALTVKNNEGYTAEMGAIDYQNVVITADDWPVNGGLDQAMCDATLVTALEFGAIDTAVTCGEVTDSSFQEEALAIIGTQ